MYAKIFAQIYDGTLCTKGPWQALVTFQQFLVLADQDGQVDMTASAISRRTTIPLEIISMGIDELLKPDPESRTPTEEGRRILPLCEGRNWGWKIVNYKHYRALKREEERREYHRAYWHKRKNSTKNSTTQPDTTKSTDDNQLNANQPIAEAEAEAYAKAKKQNTRASRFDAQAHLLNLGVPLEISEDWLKIRKSKKLPATKTAFEGIALEAAKAGLSMESAIRECCTRGWAGFKADWMIHQTDNTRSSPQKSLEARNKAVADKWVPPEMRAQG